MTRNAEPQRLSLGVLAHSRKPNERRLAIHPAHFGKIDRGIGQQIFLEHGYGAHFGATDDALTGMVGGIRTREQLIAHGREVDQIRDYLGVDSLHFLSLEGLLGVMKHEKASYCTACYSGDYRVDVEHPRTDQVLLKDQLGMF